MVGEWSPLVDVAWVRAHPEARRIDVRWYLDGRSGRDAWRAGHLPGARFVDLQTELSAPEGPGRHPIPTGEQLQVAMRRAGVNAGDFVVVYDDAGGSVAARLWWLLRYYGHDLVAVLDGGLAAWQNEPPKGFREGYEAEAPHEFARAISRGGVPEQDPPPERFQGPLEADDGRVPKEGTFVAGAPRTEWVVNKDHVVRTLGRDILLDARAPERYRGEVEPIDARAGHIPGARSAPFAANLDADGRFLPPEVLRAHYTALGVGGPDPVVVYCGSGVTACHDLLAIAVAGLPAPRLYEGSWSEWSRDPHLPAARSER